MLNRQVRQVIPFPTDEAPSRGHLSAYLGEPNIVLLGDPGSGKSHAFAEAAQVSGGALVTAREFLLLPTQELGQTLFIDALDERRAGRGDNDVIDQIIAKLFATQAKFVRISCRDRDWLGDTDLAAFRTYFNRNGGVFVLQLSDLSEDERTQVLTSKSVADPASFLTEADERGLSEFLTNPQNLLMLAEVVTKGGGWPTTFKDLFERYTDLLLSEVNAAHSTTGLGKFSPAEIADVAGAILALRLISDVEGVSLENNTTRPEYPSYRTIQVADQEKVQAVLTRRLFTASSQASTVSYTHRTTAEFLAAKWLAQRVRGGYSIGRLQALLGIDGHPASELRGLNAWLAVQLPEHAVQFINGDPYGALTYGDAACLTPSSRLALLRALSVATESDPWMRIDDSPEGRVASLFSDDAVSAFRDIIKTDTAPFPLRMLALQAIVASRGSAELISDLEAILLDEKRSYAERELSIDGLLQCGATGNTLLKKAFDGISKINSSNLRLKSDIAQALYGESILAANVGTLLASAFESEDDLAAGLFWRVIDRINVYDARKVLNAFIPSMKRLPKDRRSRRITTSLTDAYDRLLLRALEDETITVDEISRWLRARESLTEERGRATDERLPPALLRRKSLLLDVANKMIAEGAQNNRQHLAQRIRQTTLSLLTTDEIASALFEALAKSRGNSNEEAFLYDECLYVLTAVPADAVARFEMLAQMASTRSDLQCLLDSASKPIMLHHLKYSLAQRKREELEAENHKKTLAELRASQDDVRAGKHSGFTAWFARIFFDQMRDVHGDKPKERLESVIGPELLPVALEAIKTTLFRTDVPSLARVLDLHKNGKWFEWWPALIAAVDMLWDESHSIDSLSDELLSALIAIDVLHPTFEKSANTQRMTERAWRREAELNRSAAAMAAYRGLVEASLELNHPVMWGFQESQSETMASRSVGFALDLLKKYPNAEEHSLRRLLDAARNTSSATEVLQTARSLLAGGTLIAQARDRWLVTAYLISPPEFQAELIARSANDAQMVWLIRDLSGSNSRHSVSSELTLDQLDGIARIAAKHFPDAYHPTGWSGDTNPWDAADFIKSLIARISADTSVPATQTLELFLTAPEFSSYLPYIKHSIANQLVRRREVEYQQPDWESANRALTNGAPANPADLAALTADHLRDLANRIASSNGDLYRQFWNEDSFGQVAKPKHEESCRDVLLEQLRVRLLPLGVLVEPESHMFNEKRADISTALPQRKTFVELKKDHHSEVWTAINNQLDRFYTRDPDASGYGIYCVLWFGHKRGKVIPNPPTGIPVPNSAIELENALSSLLTTQQRERIRIVVIDVSGEIPN